MANKEIIKEFREKFWIDLDRSAPCIMFVDRTALPEDIEQFLLKALATQRKEIKAKSKEDFWEEEARRNHKNAMFWWKKYEKGRKEIVREIEEGLPKEEIPSRTIDGLEFSPSKLRVEGYNQALTDIKAFLKKLTS